MNHKLVSIFFIFIVFSLAACKGKSGLPDMRETYGYKETRPFGSSVAFHLLEQSYPNENIIVKKFPVAESLGWGSDSGSLYINISNRYLVNEEDANALLDYVYKGNVAFISAAEFDTLLMNKLFCEQQVYKSIMGINPLEYKNTSVKLVPAVRSVPDSVHSYFYLPFANYFSKINNIYARIVGYNGVNQPNFIVFFWGKGRMYLHSDPRAFSNYFLLKSNNYQYLMQPLSTLPVAPEHIFWDDYYNKKNYKAGEDRTSFFAFIWKNPPLKWAFWLMLDVFLLFVLFNARRKQRNIPVIKPVQNSSVAFAEAIAGLYLKEKNNKVIAEKMTTYFNEFIRTRYYLNTSTINKDFLLSLSRKAGVPLDKTEILYRTIQQLATQKEVSDYQLLNFNEQIQEFNKYKI